MHTENLGAALRIFVIGFSGVFLNLALLMGALKLIGWTAVRSELKKKAAAEKAAAEKAAAEKAAAEKAAREEEQESKKD